MSSNSPQSIGGKANAKKSRELVLANYYKSPSICKFCNSIIEVKDGERIPEVKRRSFCNQSCNSRFQSCKRKGIQHENFSFAIKKPYRKRGVKPLEEYMEEISIRNKTKGELFSKRSNWQSARSSIQGDARKSFFENISNVKCQHCNYSLHVDVCHIKPVSNFDDSTLISDINNINNLMGLCKNHHWEYDNGYLTLEQIQK